MSGSGDELHHRVFALCLLVCACGPRRNPAVPLTRNQVELMQVDTVASDRPGFRELGISARSLEEELEAMLNQSA